MYHRQIDQIHSTPDRPRLSQVFVTQSGTNSLSDGGLQTKFVREYRFLLDIIHVKFPEVII